MWLASLQHFASFGRVCAEVMGPGGRSVTLLDGVGGLVLRVLGSSFLPSAVGSVDAAQSIVKTVRKNTYGRGRAPSLIWRGVR